MRTLYLACWLLVANALGAQVFLPKKFAPGEAANMPAYLTDISHAPPAGIPTPPPFPVRTMAEWEEIQALVITWTNYQSILAEIVRYAKTETRVVIVCSNPNSVTSYLAQRGIDLQNVTLMTAPYNSIWVRDYGGNTIYQNEVDSLYLLDWIYNRPRPNDNALPAQHAAQFGLTMYETTTAPNDLIHTGGNFMSDGMGTAFSSHLVTDENPNKSEAQIDAIMQQYMGINRYIKMQTLPFDGIHHIDMHMKLLDEETLLVGQYPPGISDGPQIEANLQYVLSNFNSPFGTPYKVIRIPQPPDQFGDYPDVGDYRTYTNAVFVNKTIILPLYQQQYDTTALRIWREAMPGYRVVGIDCNSIIQASGAIHCITHSIGVNDPLRIVHQPLPNTNNTVSPYQVDALVQHRSGIDAATLYWTTDTTQGFASVPMTFTVPADDTWTGFIPAQPGGTWVYYYVEGNATNGKQAVRPMPAPHGWWRFYVSDPVGIAQPHPTLSLQTSPNPTNAITSVALHLPSASKGQLTLCDALGRTVDVLHSGQFNAGEQRFFFDAQSLAVGTYFLCLKTEGFVKMEKVVVN